MTMNNTIKLRFYKEKNMNHYDFEQARNIGKSERIAIDSYKGDLQKIVKQLETCNYTSEGGILKNNVAFVALKEMAYPILTLKIE